MPQDFQVRPFAFMRLTHEAIRDGVARCQTLAAQLPGSAAELRDVYDQTRTCIEIHASLEERGLFPLLDRLFDQAAERAGFREEHTAEDARHAAILQAFDALDAGAPDGVAALTRLLGEWSAEVENHLVHEEDIMMPLTQQVADTVEGRAQAVRAIIDTDRDSVEQQLVPWVAARLEATKPFGPVRMFVEALRASHTGADRARVEAGLRRGLDADTVARLELVGSLG